MKHAAIPKKIIFITPPYHCGIVEIAGRWMPLNFVYLAGAARRSGLRAEIYDAMAKGHGYPEIEKRLRESNADYVAVTAITSTINDALKILELAKRIRPEIVTILGGIHPTFMYDEVLMSSAQVDYIVRGEGEATLEALLSVLEASGDPATISGLAFRPGETVVTTPNRSLSDDIDGFAAAWDLLEWGDYTYFFIAGSRLGAVSTSRGCSCGSIFCSQEKFWENTWRGRDPGRVADEVEFLNSTYGVNVFLITDEHPNLDRGRWEILLDEVIARELPVHFLMETKIPEIIRDGDIIWKYRKAGVIYISIGIEAGEHPVEEAKKALDLIHGEGIVSEASFMLGLPEETSDGVKGKLELARTLNPDNANFFAVTPWPYLDIHAQVNEYIREGDYSKYNLIDPVIEPKNLTIRQMEMALAELYRKFYMWKIADVMTMKDSFRRSFMLRATRLFMGSSFIFKKMRVGMFGKRA